METTIQANARRSKATHNVMCKQRKCHKIPFVMLVTILIATYVACAVFYILHASQIGSLEQNKCTFYDSKDELMQISQLKVKMIKFQNLCVCVCVCVCCVFGSIFD